MRQREAEARRAPSGRGAEASAQEAPPVETAAAVEPPAHVPDAATEAQREAVAERVAASGSRAAARELFSSLGGIFAGGRWIILAATVAAGVLRYSRTAGVPTAEIAFGLLLLYQLVAGIVVSRLPSDRIPVLLIVALDTAALGALVVLTGGTGSPFADLFYLTVLLAAVYYDVAGGLAVAVAASMLMLAADWLEIPGFLQSALQGRVGIQAIPTLLLTGVFAGYLMGRLKQLYESRMEVEEQLRRAWYEERVRRREAELEERAREREAAVAREIQLSVLAAPPPHPEYEIAVRYEPARDVGGDFYAFFTDGRLGVLVGDVSGKGLPAALVSTSISHLVYWLRPMSDPPRFLAALNNDLVERIPEGTFATVALAVLDPRREELVFYNAGHPPPLLCREGHVEPIGRPNFPLGVVAGVRYEPERRPFGPGDLLLFYSDGFIEARNAAREEMGIEGLAALVERHAHLPAEALATELLAAVHAFGAVTDDLTLVAVRRRRAE